MDYQRQNINGPKAAFLSNGHISWLDGLRGLAAFWVLLSHIQILSGMHAIPLMSWGGLAVELFMMLSGFLMTYHYLLRSEKEPLELPSTWIKFWVRRFFRIAPLYYVLLFTAFILGPSLGEYRQTIGLLWPSPQTQTSSFRYLDQSLFNYLTHISFTFGAIPKYSFRTPLPDWSIGLEMQFYVVFPFLMLAILRFGAIKTGIVLICVCVAALKYYGNFFHQFKMPSFLPINLHMFIIGMWVALSWQKSAMVKSLLTSLSVVILLCILQRTFESVARIVMVLGMFYLMNNGTLPSFSALDKIIVKLKTLFSNSAAAFLGDTSYSVYLLHLLVLLPVAGALAQYSWYRESLACLRFGICFLLTAPIVYLCGWILYRIIEKPGIFLGKWTLKQLSRIGLYASQ
jgi:peptidoglycan/LPS O-acetylase OafA/YrhL